MILYADDILLIKPILSTEDEEMLKSDCTSISQYLETENLDVNISKTKILLASLSPKGAKPLTTTVTINNTPITQVDTLRYLGVDFDERLTFSNHSSRVAKKARCMLHAVGNTLQKWHMQDEMARIYTVCIRPIMTYAIAVAYPKTEEGKSTLERINRGAARMVLNSYQMSYTDMLQKLKWPSLAHSSMMDKLRMVHHYVNTKIGEYCDTDPPQPTQRAISSYIIHEKSRRSSRLSNGREIAVIGQFPHLSRTHSTALHDMINAWNSLPSEIVSEKVYAKFINSIEKSQEGQKLFKLHSSILL
jgi:hypothetical protein